jgi:hypothetical protein
MGLKLEPILIDGLHGIAAWRGVPVERLLIEAAQVYPRDIPAGCRAMVRAFYGAPPRRRLEQTPSVKSDVRIPRPTR